MQFSHLRSVPDGITLACMTDGVYQVDQRTERYGFGSGEIACIEDAQVLYL